MAQEKSECSHACVNYNIKQQPLNNGQSERKVIYRLDFKRMGSLQILQGNRAFLAPLLSPPPKVWCYLY